MVRQTIVFSRSCFFVQKYISPFDKQKKPHLSLNFKNLCWIQALLIEEPKFILLLGDSQYCAPARCSVLPASACSCETFPGNMAFIYQVALSLCMWLEEYGDSLAYRYLLVPADLLINGGVSCGCETGTKQSNKTIY